MTNTPPWSHIPILAQDPVLWWWFDDSANGETSEDDITQHSESNQ